MSKEASLVAKYKEPVPRTPEEVAEDLAYIEMSKNESEAIEGAGGKAELRIQASGAKGMILVEMTSRTIIKFKPKGGECVCGEKIEIDEGDIKTAGMPLSGRPRTPPFSMVSKYQALTEEAGRMFSGKQDVFKYAENYIGFYVKVKAAPELDYASSMNSTISLKCFNCGRIHNVQLKYTAPGKWPALESDPIDLWRKYGVNLKSPATKSALDQFAHREGMGLAKDAIEYVEKQLGRMDAVEAQLEAVRASIELLDLPGSGGDVRDLETALRQLEGHAEDAQRFFAMSWIYKALGYMGEYWNKSSDEAESVLRGNWRAPEWYHEGRR